jgi:phasin family protein
MATAPTLESDTAVSEFPRTKPAAASPVKPVARKAQALKPAPAKKAAPATSKPTLKAKSAPVAALEKELKMNTETLTKSFEAQVGAIAPAMEKATQEAMAQAKTNYDALNTKLRETMETSMKSMTEVTEFAKGNVEALVASAKAAAAGAEVLATKATETSKKSMEDAAVAIKSMTAAKTPNEYMQLQNDFAKTQFDAAVASWSHMSETMLKLAGDVVQPLSSRMAIAAETMKSAVAVK